MESWEELNSEIVACEACPRMVAYRQEVARTKRRAFREWEYWGRPVLGFGDRNAQLLIVGLAPGAHGANRTGRMFTGDSSGDWLFAALHASDFAKTAHSLGRDDGQMLREAYISAAVRCAPPDNKPAPREIVACSGFLTRELVALRHLEVLLCLGQIAFTAALRLLQNGGYEIPRPRPRFAHAAEFLLQPGPTAARTRPLRLLASYHPSRQNTQTGRLTRPMWQAVFERARQLLR